MSQTFLENWGPLKLYSCQPNPFGDVGFVLGWEPAFLGNCLTSLANMVVLSIRTGIPIIYPHIEDHRIVFSDPERTRAIFDPREALKGKRVWEFNAYINSVFDGYFPGYSGRIVGVDYPDLRSFEDAHGIMLFLPYRQSMTILDWRSSGMEEAVGRFCSRGNGLILAGAYWNQYVDMREAALYGPELRRYLGVLRGDQCAPRAHHMQTHRDYLKIAIHIRQSDSRNWHGGAYYYELQVYQSVMRHIHQSLGARPHVFYVFSEMQWSDVDFEGVPVFYEKAHFVDDFVTMGTCDYVVGPPSTFATWSAFLGGGKRVILTKERIAELARIPSLLDLAVDIGFPTGAYLPGDPMARPL